MLVFGTRPEAIKVAPLIKELKNHPDEFDTIVTVTGQHREMLDQVLDLFEIKLDYDLNIMKTGQDLYDVTSRVLLGLRDILKNEKPDLIFVHGDTTTSMSAAIAAYYQQIPVAHIEAGLRTNNIYSPWPEEINRQVIGRLAAINLAPTPLSRSNLLKENVLDDSITVTGNTVIDALHLVTDKIKSSASLATDLGDKLFEAGYDVKRLKSGCRKLVLITGHRRENFGTGFRNISNAIKTLSEKYPETDFVYPMHLNPNVRKPLTEVFGEDLVQHKADVGTQKRNVFFIEPLDYLPFVFLMEQCDIVLTDSGGIQEEAPGLGKPVLVMRNTTERPEAVDAGTVKLVGTDFEKIVSETSKLLDDKQYYDQMAHAVNPYGDGKACGRIIKFVSEKLISQEESV